MALTCEVLLEKYAPLWKDATSSESNPFLKGVKEGTIESQHFNTWLIQDYNYVKAFTSYAGSTLGRCPHSHQKVLLDGIGALKGELEWFEAKAIERGMDLATPVHPNCAAYCAFLRALQEKSYVTQAALFWGIEKLYNEAWKGTKPCAPQYEEFANRWGSPEFTEYVKNLHRQANEALKDASAEEQQEIDELTKQMLHLELGFWDMSMGK